MDDFKGSSLVSRAVEEEKREKKEPIVSAENITVKKESEVRKFLKPIFQEDIKSVGKYSLTEVIVPKVKETIVDTFKKAIDFMVWGGSKPSKDSSYYSSEVSYNKYYGGSRSTVSSYSTRQTPSTTVRDIIFKNVVEAEEVLKRLIEDCIRYGSVCVGDFYELTGQPSTLTDQNWGWTDLGGAEVDRIRDGYIIRFPRVISLKR